MHAIMCLHSLSMFMSLCVMYVFCSCMHARMYCSLHVFLLSALDYVQDTRTHTRARTHTHTHTHTGSDRASASHEAQVCASVCEDMRANRMRCNDKLNGLERFATQMHEEWKTLTFYFPGLTNWPVPENRKVNASRFLFGFHVYACACKARIMHTVILCNHAARED